MKLLGSKKAKFLLERRDNFCRHELNVQTRLRPENWALANISSRVKWWVLEGRGRECRTSGNRDSPWRQRWSRVMGSVIFTLHIYLLMKWLYTCSNSCLFFIEQANSSGNSRNSRWGICLFFNRFIQSNVHVVSLAAVLGERCVTSKKRLRGRLTYMWEKRSSLKEAKKSI